MKFSAVFVTFVMASVTAASPVPNRFNPFEGFGGRFPFFGLFGGHRGQTCGTPGQVGNGGQNNQGGKGGVSNNQGGAAPAGTVGAAYLISNEAAGNVILSANIGKDGKLSFGKATLTGGAGAHGVTDPANSPDPLFSQGSVKVSAAAKMLATVNPGSNTVSLFKIDENNPANLTMVGFPISTEGEFPMSLAFNKNGKNLCVLNGGAVNGVMCFKVDGAKGLTPNANSFRTLNLNQTTPANGPAGTTSQVIFSEDGSKLHASIKGVPPQPGFVATWSVAADGSLSKDFTKSTPGKGGLLPFSMTVIPGKNAVLATDAGVGFDIFDFKQGNQANQATSSVIPIKGQKATCWSSFSKKTGNFYLTDIGTSLVTEVKVDNNLKGSIVQQVPQGDGTATIDNDVASIGDKDFLYVLLANATTISVSSLDAPGKVTNVQKFNFGDAAKAARMPVNPANVQGMTTFIKA